MEQDSDINHLALVKTNRVSKYIFLCRNYASSSKKYYPIIILACLRKMNQ